MSVLRGLIPLAMIVSLVIVAIRRRREKKKRFEGQDGRT
jgi:hypothetical protein